MTRTSPVEPPLGVSHYFRHPPERVFELWMDPESVKVWMCPAPEIRISDLQWPAEVGAAYRIVMDLGDHEVAFSGKYVEITPPRRFSFTWSSTRTDEVETLVTVELQEVDDGTSLQLTHERLPTPEAVEAHLGGWVNILARLEHLLDEAA